MSNDLAIATVTAGLRRVVSLAFENSPLDGTDVDTERPDDPGQNAGTPRVTVFLYQARQNTAWRNEDLPTRSGDGALMQRPQVALDLDYLLSFFGNETEFVPHRLLGRAVRRLHSTPLLGRMDIEAAITAATPVLDGSDLADQVVSVKFTPLSLSLEELSKVWSVFLQVPYALSVAYRASVVLIEAEDPPRQPLPVRRRQIFVAPLRRPVIECAVATEGASAPIFSDSVLELQGRQLAGSITRVRIDDQEATPLTAAPDRVTVDLAGLSFAAGTHRAQVLQPVPDAPEQLRFASNAVPFVLRPRILPAPPPTFTPAADPLPARVEATLDVPVEEGQSLMLLLNEFLAPDVDATPRSFVFEAPAGSATVLPGNTVSLPVTDLPAATYLLRVQVDGAESPLDVDENAASPTFERYIGPTVVVP